MKLKVIVHEAEEGGYWAEVPAIPGCATQGEDVRGTPEQPLRGGRRLPLRGCSRYSHLRQRQDRRDRRVKSVSGKRFCRLLELRGWTLMRTSGSHRIYAKAGSDIRISVPVHGSASLKRGLQRHLMKLADIRDSDL